MSVYNFSQQDLVVALCRFTYIIVLDEEMLAGSFPLHRQHITMFLPTLPHQEVSVALQQLLDLQPGNGSMVPVLLLQRTVHLLHRAEDRHLRTGTENSRILKADMNNETIKRDRSWLLGRVCRDYVEVHQRRGCNTLKSKCASLHAFRIPQSWETEGEAVHTSNNVDMKSNTLYTLKYYLLNVIFYTKACVHVQDLSFGQIRN